MNPVETEPLIRELELLIGRTNMGGDDVRAVPTPSPEEPEFAVEMFQVGPNGEMSVIRPGPNSNNP